MNKTLKSIFAIGGIVLLTSFFFTSCAVDDNEEDNANGAEMEEIEPLPTEDVIETTIVRNAAIFGNNFDEVTQKVIDRLKGITEYLDPVTASSIPENVELIFIDNESLLKMERPAVMAIKEAFQRGATVYLHKPNDFAAALFNIAMFDDIDNFFGNQAKMRAQTRSGNEYQNHDLFAVRLDQSYMDADDLFNDEPIEQTFVNEDTGEETTESFQPSAPTNYQLGRYAENAVKWIESENAETVRAKTRAASSSTDPFAQHHIHKLISCNLNYPYISKYNKDFPDITATFDISVDLWVITAYSFEKQMDYYNVVMQEVFPGAAAYKGDYWRYGINKKNGMAFSKLNWEQQEDVGFDRGAYVYAGPDIYVFKPEGYTVEQPSTESPVNKNNYYIRESYSSWGIKGELGYSDGSVGGKLSFDYRKGETITSFENELEVTLNRNYSYENRKATYWDYEMNVKNNNLKWCGLKKEISKDALCRKDCETRQYWEWFISDTNADISKNIEFDVVFEFPAYSAKCNVTGYNNGFDFSRSVLAKQKVRFKLPIPYRYNETYTTFAEKSKENIADVKAVEEALAGSTYIKEFKFKQSNITKKALDNKLTKEWNTTIDNLLRNIQVFVDNEVSVYLNDSKGNHLGDRLVFSPDSPNGYPQREKVE